MTGTSRNGRARGGRVGRLRRLAEPRGVRVATAGAGRPTRVAGRTVIAIRESWLVEDRWWAETAVRRHYWEVIDSRGAVTVIFREPGGSWRAHS